MAFASPHAFSGFGAGLGWPLGQLLCHLLVKLDCSLDRCTIDCIRVRVVALEPHRCCLQSGCFHLVEFVEPGFGSLDLLVNGAASDCTCARMVPDQLQFPDVLDNVTLTSPARVGSGVPYLRGLVGCRFFSCRQKQFDRAIKLAIEAIDRAAIDQRRSGQPEI